MSYTIIKNAMFLRTKTGRYLPMVLAGDNNLIGYDNKPVMTWETWGGCNAPMDVEEVMAIPRSRRESCMSKYEDYTDKSFGWYIGISVGNKRTADTTYKMFENIFKKGMENSITFPDLESLRITLMGCYYNLELGTPTTTLIANEDELDKFMEANRDRHLYFTYRCHRKGAVEAYLFLRKPNAKGEIILTDKGYITTDGKTVGFTNEELKASKYMIPKKSHDLLMGIMDALDLTDITWNPDGFAKERERLRHKEL